MEVIGCALWGAIAAGYLSMLFVTERSAGSFVEGTAPSVPYRAPITVVSRAHERTATRPVPVTRHASIASA